MLASRRVRRHIWPRPRTSAQARLAVAVGCTTATSTLAFAHVQYHDLDQPPALVTTTFSGSPIDDPCAGKAKGCQSSNAFTRFGWIKGTEPQLSDSHLLTVNAEFWKFHLDQTSPVVITFTQVQAGLDPAISLYSGLLPDMGHDDTPVDPLNPGDVNGCGAPSPVDDHEPPYTYLPHDGFRDTQAGSTTGGVSGCRPLNPYLGQFDAFASWSLGNFAGDWSEIHYVASVSATAFTGNDQGSHVDGNHLAIAGSGETLTITLPPGDYTIAAGGEACSAAVTTCTSPRLYGTVSYSIGSAPGGPDAGTEAPVDAGVEAGDGGAGEGGGALAPGAGHGGGCSASASGGAEPWMLGGVVLAGLGVRRRRRQAARR